MDPYCFILMPFGEKIDRAGHVVQFESIYQDIIVPAVADAHLQPIRADEELTGGIIHKPMFERLMLCDYAVADLTTANPNVLYELGIRHGVRPHSTVPIAARGMRLPFDVAPLRAVLYELNSLGQPTNASAVRQELAQRLEECRDPVDDSPLYQLLTSVTRPNIERLKTDTFRDAVQYAQEVKHRLREARAQGRQAIVEVESNINVVDAEPGIVIDLYLSYRAVEAWDAMVSLTDQMAPPLKQTILVQEQLGLALNRLERHEDAEAALTELIRQQGPSSETNGILGRVYKDLWDKTKDSGSPAADAYLTKAIDTYLQGFEADWRDAYPGVNAVTLMEMRDPPDSRQKEVLPVVEYAVKRRLASKDPDYWDYATLLELSVLSEDRNLAREYLGYTLAQVRESWEPKTTARNIRMIRERRAARGEDAGWIERIEEELRSSKD